METGRPPEFSPRNPSGHGPLDQQELARRGYIFVN